MSFKSPQNFLQSLVTNWLFTEKGTAFVTLIWGAMMGLLAIFTDGLRQYAPFSYGCAVALGLFIGLHLCRVFNNMFLRRKTKKQTYIDYKFDNNLLEIVGRQNIYKMSHSITAALPINNQEAANSQPFFIVVFERPIHASHIYTEEISGKAPLIQTAFLDDGFAYFTLVNYASPSRFKIIFQ